MFGRRIKLFKLLGFEVRIDLSWIVIAVLVTWSLAAGLFPHFYPMLHAANLLGDGGGRSPGALLLHHLP